MYETNARPGADLGAFGERRETAFGPTPSMLNKPLGSTETPVPPMAEPRPFPLIPGTLSLAQLRALWRAPRPVALDPGCHAAIEPSQARSEHSRLGA